MIQIIAGEKGNGKTKHLLEKANAEIKSVNGNIVYLDKNAKHMYELNNRVRLIDVSEYKIKSADEFIGFMKGIISQDNDLEQLYLDSFLKVANLEDADITDTLNEIESMSDKFHVNIVLSISVDASRLPDNMKDKVISQ